MKKYTLESVEDLRKIVINYHTHFPSEAKIHGSPVVVEGVNLSLLLFLSSSIEELYSRKNFQGHLTASAFILDAAGENVLLLHHKSLDRWLQPGGHIDHTDQSILDAAYREVQEESGIAKENLKLHAIGDSKNIPFDIDSHYIPANPNKDEAPHVHHDFRYLLQMREEGKVAIHTDESNNHCWVSLKELGNIEDHARVAKKISELRNT